jgi:hypothetical protein
MLNGMAKLRGCVLMLATLQLPLAGAAAAQVLVPNLVYTTIKPCRILDTRSSVDGKLLTNTPRTFNVVGNTTGTYFTDQGGTSGGCAVPGFQLNEVGEVRPGRLLRSAAGAGVRGAALRPHTVTEGLPQVQAVVINLAVINPAATGFLNAWPSDQSMPSTSLVNFVTGIGAIANEAIVAVRQDTQGADITVISTSNTQLVGDIVGYFSAGSATTTDINSNQNNVYLGTNAGNPLTAASSGNVAIGYQALGAETNGGNNIAIGTGAMGAATEPGENIGIGPGALNNLTTGSFNIVLGATAGDNLTTESGNILIGHNGVAGDVGVIRIGDADSSVFPPTAAFVAGVTGVTSPSGTAVYINSDGQLGTSTSSLRFKDDVQDIGDASAGLMRLRPVSFHYKPQYDDGAHLLQYGLVAEEVAEIYPDLVQRDRDGRPIAIRTHFINAMMLNEVQRQHHTIADQQSRLDAQAAQIAELQRQVQTLLAAQAAAARADGPR